MREENWIRQLKSLSQNPHKMSRAMFGWDDEGLQQLQVYMYIFFFSKKDIPSFVGHMSLPSVVIPEVLSGWHPSLLLCKKKQTSKMERWRIPSECCHERSCKCLWFYWIRPQDSVKIDHVIWRAGEGPRLFWMHKALPVSRRSSFPTLNFSSWQISSDFCSLPFSEHLTHVFRWNL